MGLPFSSGFVSFFGSNLLLYPKILEVDTFLLKQFANLVPIICHILQYFVVLSGLRTLRLFS
jgi:hypothetical protein